MLLTCSNSAVAHFEVRATDSDGPVVCVPPSGSEIPLGVTNVTCSATDILGGSTNCSFGITVKAAPPRWPCPPTFELGLGVPFETVNGATTVVRPGPTPAGVAVQLHPTNAESGIVLKPGTAQAISFVAVLDFTAPEGSGFDLVLPPNPLHPE
ncbi:MAG: hypothetical protein IPK15_19050 [Verrucomicrobia bacterium]|nr:hypothetical protein [Verrucomicrobiota bacterium]